VFIVGFFGDGGERAAEVLAIEEGRRRFIGTGGKEESKPTVGSPKRTANDLIHTFSKARLALEDSDNGAMSAFSAGIRVIVVPDLKQPSSVTKEIALAICNSLLEVKEMILQNFLMYDSHTSLQ
jgi:hypothetical protein